MKSLFFVVFALLFVSSIFAAPADWEGVYVWSGSGTDVAYNCYEDGWIYGTAGHVLTWAARVNDAGTEAWGKWWGAGFKHGGPRWGQSQNGPTTGYVRVTLASAGVMTVEISYRGHKTHWVNIQLGERSGTTVDDRIPNCGIMDPSSTESLHGKWKEDNSASSAQEESYICVDGKDVVSSYSAVDPETEEPYTGYTVGKCSWDGKVCRTDWYEDPGFGVQIDRLLSDGTKGTIWWTGPTAFITADSVGASYVNNRKSETASDTHCAENSAQMIWPFKCQTFESIEDCEANPYYCKVRQSNGKCRKVHYKTSHFHW